MSSEGPLSTAAGECAVSTDVKIGSHERPSQSSITPVWPKPRTERAVTRLPFILLTAMPMEKSGLCNQDSELGEPDFPRYTSFPLGLQRCWQASFLAGRLTGVLPVVGQHASL